MPKGRRSHSLSSDRSRASPFPSSSSRARRSSSKNPLDPVEDVKEWKKARWSSSKKPLEYINDMKEWEEARCPVCMEHPHNAVLLSCSSHDKGCRPYMCDTSYRHSNCLDQFRKAFTEASSTMPPQEETSLLGTALNMMTSEATPIHVQQETIEGWAPTIPCESPVQLKLLCPLCRGQVNGWSIEDSARQFMNAKTRSCASETCDFSGTYAELRKHARLEHPLVRPSEADPERERDWRRLERQRDIGDVLSTFQSTFGDERDEDDTFSINEGSWLTFILLVRVIRPGTGTSSGWSGASRVRGQLRSRRRTITIWGESSDMESGSAAEGDDESSEEMSPTSGHRDHGRQQTRPDDEP